MSIEAMKLALEALDRVMRPGPSVKEAITALRAAIEQAQEPVAWMWADGTITTDPDRADGTWTPLYTAPRQWQGLTDDELFAIWMKSPAETEDRFAFVKTVMERLKEKNK